MRPPVKIIHEFGRDEDYYAFPAISASAVNSFIQGPSFVFPKKAADFGNVLHSLVLEGVSLEFPTLYDSDYSLIFDMAQRVHGSKEWGIVSQLTLGIEKGVLFECDGLLMKAKCDILGKGFVYDLKSTSKPSPEKAVQSIQEYNYMIPAACYCAAFGVDTMYFHFVQKKPKGYIQLTECKPTAADYDRWLEAAHELDKAKHVPK